MGKPLNMTKDRYVAAMKRQRLRIAQGLILRAVDDTTPGDKSTTCTWGLCSDEKAAWPDAQDHLWPDQFTKDGRVAPLYRKTNQKCPLDRRDNAVDDWNGCFYTCRVFSPAKDEKRLNDPVQAVIWYDRRLREVGAI